MEDSTPILVGAGQFTEKDVPPQDAHSPMGIAGEAAKAALADTGVGDTLAPQIDTVAVTRIFPDSSNRPRLQHPWGRAENPPRAVARRVGANPTNAIYTHVGGNTPQKMINEMCERIVAGDVGVALLAGSEAIATAKAAARAGLDLDWQEDDEGSLEDRGIGGTFVTPHEFAHGIGIPIQTYPLFEQAIRKNQGESIDEHMLSMGKLFEPFTRVAAANPYSFYGVERTAEELATVTPDNRFICFPYPKWMNAMDGVNQGAAVILTSVGKAKQLGIDPAKWVFLHGCAEANEKILVSDRVNYHSSPAIKINTAKAFEMAGKTVDDIDFIDIYSCFPSAVEVAADALGIAYDDPRGLTVTGGLPFFGGPGNNYSMNGIAQMAPMLRAKPGSFGLITANGGYLTKHATGIYSTTPTEGTWSREDPAGYQAEIDAMESPTVTETPDGAATIETYTVCFGRNGAERGIVIGRLDENGHRFVANTPDDAATLNDLMEHDSMGRSGTVSTNGDGMSTFTPA
ncbi:MAG: acetyl-CoA acetyltransferase [Alphaproteobacteria bacterium]